MFGQHRDDRLKWITSVRPIICSQMRVHRQGHARSHCSNAFCEASERKIASWGLQPPLHEGRGCGGGCGGQRLLAVQGRGAGDDQLALHRPQLLAPVRQLVLQLLPPHLAVCGLRAPFIRASTAAMVP